jgi:hypothetical protein
MDTIINEIFVNELFKASLTSRSFLEVVQQHVQYHYLPGKHYKALLQKIIQLFELNNTLPTIGSLSQSFSKDEEILKILQKVRNSDITDKHDSLLTILEKFIINARFISLYNDVGRLHNEGKQEQALELLQKESQAINDFSIKDTYYSSIFANFEKRNEERALRPHDLASSKIPFSMAPTDFYTRGGMSRGTSTCFMARSGAGKSTAKRWVGVSAARLGFRVVHFQAEGTEQECFDAYDSAWTGVRLEDMEFGDIPAEKLKAILKAHKDILARKGDVFIKASENFDEMSINDCRDVMDEIVKIHGPVDLGIFDYAELFTTNKKYPSTEAGERRRREDISNKITNIATIFNCATLTSTQANDIKPEKWNDPNYYMTRSDISEFKGFVKPFSTFITFNQTEDEYEAGVLRMYHDKFRKYRSGQLVKIAQSLDNSRFFNSQKTYELFWDEKLNRPKYIKEEEPKKKK